MATGALVYTLYMFTGAFTGYCSTNLEHKICESTSIFSINIFSSLLLGGFGSTLLWTGQYIFINKLAKDSSHLFAQFYTLFNFSKISGNVFNYVFYTFSPDIILYFSIFVGFCFFSFILFTFLPKVYKEKSLSNNGNYTYGVKSLEEEDSLFDSGYIESEAEEEDKEEIVKKKKIGVIFKTMFSKNVLKITPYMFLSGILQGVSGAFLYIVTTRTCKGFSDVEINKKISLTMIINGCFSVLIGRVLQKIIKKSNLRPLVVFTSILFIFFFGGIIYVWFNPNYYLMFIVNIYSYFILAY